MVRNLLICGLIAGACAGLTATGFAKVVGEPAVDQAIAFEDAQAKAAGEAPKPELVSRDIQSSVGLGTAATVYGLALGGIFALVFAGAYGRVGRVSPIRTACWLAAAAFVVLYLVPFVKYPANPPSVGNPDTIAERTWLYLSMIAISILAAIAALRVRAALAPRWPGMGANVAAGALYLLVVVVGGLALPGIHEVPRGFSAATLFRFRESSIGMQAVLWLVIALVFAPTADRVMRGKPILPWRSQRAVRDGASALH
jgi:Probable cobalt transporter subunit (CbtA)